MIKIAPSILSADHGRLAEEIQAMEEAGADWIHIDIMDGHFVPNLTFGPWVVETARRHTNLPLDVHLMITDPLTYGPIFAKAGADFVSIHAEATVHLHRCLEAIQTAGAKPGAVLNPSTPIETIRHCLGNMRLLVLMGVNPGFGGQKFIPETTIKTREVKTFLKSRNIDVPIEIDGGVNDCTAAELAAAGADILVSGSYLFKAPNYKTAINQLRLVADKATSQ